MNALKMAHSAVAIVAQRRAGWTVPARWRGEVFARRPVQRM